MNNNTAFSTTATREATAARPVQNSFFEPVQTSLFNLPAIAVIAPPQEQPRINVHCDICSDYDYATAQSLEARGWGLYDDFQFCPYHEEQS